MKLNIISWLFWLLIPLSTVGLTYYHFVNNLDYAFYPIHHDKRIAELGKFFSEYHFAPIKPQIFLQCSDEYGLDYRILPVIALKESGGGKRFTPGTNNIMGIVYRDQNNVDELIQFSSVQDSICASAKLLHHLKPQTLEGKIKEYNSVNPDYWPDTLRLMNQMVK